MKTKHHGLFTAGLTVYMAIFLADQSSIGSITLKTINGMDFPPTNSAYPYFYPETDSTFKGWWYDNVDFTQPANSNWFDPEGYPYYGGWKETIQTVMDAAGTNWTLYSSTDNNRTWVPDYFVVTGWLSTVGTYPGADTKNFVKVRYSSDGIPLQTNYGVFADTPMNVISTDWGPLLSPAKIGGKFYQFRRTDGSYTFATTQVAPTDPQPEMWQLLVVVVVGSGLIVAGVVVVEKIYKIFGDQPPPPPPPPPTNGTPTNLPPPPYP